MRVLEGEGLLGGLGGGLLTDSNKLGGCVVVCGEVIVVEFAKEGVLFSQTVDLAVALGDVPT